MYNSVVKMRYNRFLNQKLKLHCLNLVICKQWYSTSNDFKTYFMRDVRKMWFIHMFI